MGYKLLGFVVWQGSKLYMRRRLSGTSQKVVIAAVAGGALAGGFALQRVVRSRGD
jgi:enoyl-CoA hydratase/carnithine racemase